jgi:CheY-like chemotaxis protein
MARILVIDDEESIRKLLHTVLKRKGHEVFLADSGQRTEGNQHVRADASAHYHS